MLSASYTPPANEQSRKEVSQKKYLQDTFMGCKERKKRSNEEMRKERQGRKKEIEKD
jgi:hypothetical protein